MLLVTQYYSVMALKFVSRLYDVDYLSIHNQSQNFSKIVK